MNALADKYRQEVAELYGCDGVGSRSRKARLGDLKVHNRANRE